MVWVYAQSFLLTSAKDLLCSASTTSDGGRRDCHGKMWLFYSNDVIDQFTYFFSVQSAYTLIPIQNWVIWPFALTIFGSFWDRLPGSAFGCALLFALSDLGFRCLQYWQIDRSLDIALDNSSKYISVIDHLLDIWPCPGKHEGYMHHNLPFLITVSCRGKPADKFAEF